MVVLGLIMLVAFRLARSGPTTATEQAGAVPSDNAVQDTRTTLSGNKPQGGARPLIPMTEPMQKTLTGWVLDLESTNPQVVQAARQALAELGPEAAPAIPQLARMLNDGRACNSAAWALVKIGTNALPALLDALTNGNRYARLEVAGAISWFREDAEGAVPGLVECMKDEDPGARGNAIAALQVISKRPDIAVPALIAALADPDLNVRDNAVTVLRKYGQVQAEVTVPMLVQAAGNDENLLIRFRAAEVLRAVAPERAKAERL